MDSLLNNEYFHIIIFLIILYVTYQNIILPCLRITEHYNSKCCPDDYPNLIFDWKNIPTCYSKKNLGTDPKPDCLPPNFLKKPFTTSVPLSELRKDMPQMPDYSDRKYAKRKERKEKIIPEVESTAKTTTPTTSTAKTPTTSTAKTTTPTPTTSTAKTTTPTTSTAKTTTPTTSTAKTTTPTTSTAKTTTPSTAKSSSSPTVVKVPIVTSYPKSLK
jgi:hypothetical protein